jgi:hypothetical protein
MCGCSAPSRISAASCPHCGGRSEIFSHGGARQEADRLGTEFLCEVPLDLKIRETSDGGTPVTIADPDNPHALVFRGMAARIWDKGLRRKRRSPPAAADRHRIGAQSSTFAARRARARLHLKVRRAIFETPRDLLFEKI